jgi:hypothetical protein
MSACCQHPVHLVDQHVLRVYSSSSLVMTLLCWHEAISRVSKSCHQFTWVVVRSVPQNDSAVTMQQSDFVLLSVSEGIGNFFRFIRSSTPAG